MHFGADKPALTLVPLEEIDESYYRVVGNIPFEETPLLASNLPLLDESVGLRFLPAPLLEHKGARRVPYGHRGIPVLHGP